MPDTDTTAANQLSAKKGHGARPFRSVECRPQLYLPKTIHEQQCPHDRWRGLCAKTPDAKCHPRLGARSTDLYASSDSCLPSLNPADFPLCTTPPHQMAISRSNIQGVVSQNVSHHRSAQNAHKKQQGELSLCGFRGLFKFQNRFSGNQGILSQQSRK